MTKNLQWQARRKLLKFKDLKDKLDYEHLYFEKFRDGERFIVVPVEGSLQTINNKNKPLVNSLLLIEDKSGNTRKGNIVQYIPESSQDLHIPSGSFFKIFNGESFNQDAQFSFLTIADRRAYDIKYKDGKMISSGVVRPSVTGVNSPPQDPIGPDPICTDWYLVTTYYYLDGTTDQTEEYLYTTCVPNQGGGGSGGGNDVEYEFEALRSVEWNVIINPVEGIGEVKSYETIKGRRVASEPQGGHFKSISHSDSYCDFCTWPGEVWDETSVALNAADQLASSSISGILYYHQRSFSRSSTHTWSFQSLFP